MNVATSDAVRRALEQLVRDGLLRAEDIVEAARAPTSPLHPHFEWDDSEAAHQHRLEQARRLVRVFVSVEPGLPDGGVRAFVSLSSDRVNGGGYRVLADVLQDADLYACMLKDALRELQAIRQKYRRVRELDHVFKKVEEAIEEQGRRLIRAAA